MTIRSCSDRTVHGPHEWYEHWILLRECPGLTVAFCGRDDTHVPHWHGEYRSEWCNGAGLAGRCAHGVQMLDYCEPCCDNPDPAVRDVLELRRRDG